MSFHLAHPSLSTTGKRKGKRRFRNAAEAQKARDNKNDWEELLKKYSVEAQETKRQKGLDAPVYKPKPLSYRGSDAPRIPSRETTWEPCTKAPEKVYTGEAMLGIVVQHKSCLQPVFSQEAAKDSAKMRR